MHHERKAVPTPPCMDNPRPPINKCVCVWGGGGGGGEGGGIHTMSHLALPYVKLVFPGMCSSPTLLHRFPPLDPSCPLPF